MMNRLLTLFFMPLLALGIALSANAQTNPVNLSGLAAFEQLHKEYYIGGLYLGWPGHDTATILAMPGRRQMELRITADRWSALRFAQMWNQAITINNDSATLNTNALDIVAFTSIPKGDLQEGDQLNIEGDPNTGTRVTLNGVLVLHAKNPALFNLILNAWIGSRPPNSEFKRGMLTLPTTQEGTALTARYEAIHPNDARKKAIAAWGIKPELDTTPIAAAAAAVTTVTATASKAPEVAAPKAEPSSAAPAPAKVVAATPATTTPPVAATVAPTKVAPSQPEPQPAPEPTKVAAAPAQPESATVAAAQPANADKEKEQAELYNQYLRQIHKQVIRRIEYPRRAQKEGIEGLVMLSISIDREGNLVSSSILQSADDVLDEAAENAVKKAAPFPKPPENLEGNRFVIRIPVVFKLTQ